MQTYSVDGTRGERTGWRDESISLRHRDWGFNCPAVDLDFLMVEYNQGAPVGLVEYKANGARMPRFDHPTYRALGQLATGHSRMVNGRRVHDPLPFLLAFYWPGSWTFVVHPVNEAAERHFKSPEVMSEFDYVSRLYRLRRLTLTNLIQGNLRRDVDPAALTVGRSAA